MYYDFLSTLLKSNVAKFKIMFQITSEIFQNQDLKPIKNLTIAEPQCTRTLMKKS